MRLGKHEQKLFLAAAGATIVAALLYCSWPLGFWLNPAATRHGLASELGAFGQPYNWLFIWADIISGALLLASVAVLLRLYKLRGRARQALIYLAIYGVCGALDAALPMHCLPSEQVCGPILHDPMLILHGTIDMIGSVALIGTLVAVTLYARSKSQTWLPWIYAIYAAAILYALLSLAFLVLSGPGYWAQRYYITLSCIWVASMPFVLRPKRAMLVRLNH